MAPKPMPNGTVEAPIEVSSIPAVVGINFGNAFASIAVFTKVTCVLYWRPVEWTEYPEIRKDWRSA